MFFEVRGEGCHALKVLFPRYSHAKDIGKFLSAFPANTVLTAMYDDPLGQLKFWVQDEHFQSTGCGEFAPTVVATVDGDKLELMSINDDFCYTSIDGNSWQYSQIGGVISGSAV